ncbi:hypothetical protein QZH41_008651, partial [Actinostola sp. cb2023]
MKTRPLSSPPGDFIRPDLYTRRRWRRVQYLADQFWARWRREYMHTLQARSKWEEPKRDLVPGDIVLVKEDGSNRNEWPMGRISEAIKSDDDKVRKAKVDLVRDGKKKTFLRPIKELILLLTAEPEMNNTKPQTGVAVSRVLMDRQTTEALRVAFSNVFSSETARFPSFENGKSLQGITVDFSDAESRALHEVLGKNLAPNLLRECKVHWQRSCMKVGSMVCMCKEKSAAFKRIAAQISTEKEKTEVLDLFAILAGDKPVPSKYGANIVNNHWRRLQKWKLWWTRESHLRMFTVAYQTMRDDTYNRCPSTTNPVENINRNSNPGKVGMKSLISVLEYLYKTDKLAVAKRVGCESHVTVNYADKSDEARKKNNERKRKWRRSKGETAADDAE